MAKLFGSIMESKITRAKKNGKRAYGQDEFWKHHNTINHIVTRRALTEESNLRAKCFYFCLVYFNVDMVPHEHLWRLMEELVVSSEYMLAISWLYEKIICCAWYWQYMMWPTSLCQLSVVCVHFIEHFLELSLSCVKTQFVMELHIPTHSKFYHSFP